VVGVVEFYDGLVRFSAEMNLEPSLAQSWEQVDATHWKFHLRKNVRFQRGSRFGPPTSSRASSARAPIRSREFAITCSA